MRNRVRAKSTPRRRAGAALSYEPQPGELFAGRYRVDRLLGRGATGAVWAAFDEEVGDRVALKLLTGGPDDAAERFRREVRLARRVTHRNAARIFDLGTANGVLYLTMELVEGDSLHALITREVRLSVPRAADIASQIANGLAAAHDVGVVHRDIKPANVLLDQAGRVVLTDFGLARAVAADSKVTIGAQMIGTPSYMAPEQVRGEAVGPRPTSMRWEPCSTRCSPEGVPSSATEWWPRRWLASRPTRRIREATRRSRTTSLRSSCVVCSAHPISAPNPPPRSRPRLP